MSAYKNFNEISDNLALLKQYQILGVDTTSKRMYEQPSVEMTFAIKDALGSLLDQLDNELVRQKNMKTLKRIDVLLKTHKITMQQLVVIKEDYIAKRRRENEQDLFPSPAPVRKQLK